MLGDLIRDLRARLTGEGSGTYAGSGAAVLATADLGAGPGDLRVDIREPSRPEDRLAVR
jgi:hypothetical protein